MSRCSVRLLPEYRTGRGNGTGSCRGTDLEAKEGAKAIHVCDLASAGNTWDRSVGYKVWLPKTLNVMKEPYQTYNQ